jgi:DNA-binding transcriptional MerR regulator
MRIGEFADHNNLNIDTVRYYTDLNLIHPIRKGRYFYFEKAQQEELNRLLYLKDLRFTLEEIKKIMTAEDLNSIRTSVESSLYEDMLLRKRDELKREASEISTALKEIEAEIERAGQRQDDLSLERGISFKNLHFLCCPRCGSEIEISEGILKGNGIYEGMGGCSCGYSLSIREGIVVTKQNYDDVIEPYVEGVNYKDAFVNETPKELVDIMISSAKEIIRLLMEKDLSDKGVLFMKSGLGMLETWLLGQTDHVKLMILVDDDYNKLRVAKKSIESSFPNVNAIYICSELYELPVGKDTMDIAVDFLATFLNGFRMDISFYGHIIPILKGRSSIMGLYLYFKNFNMLSRLPESRRYIFDGRSIPKTIRGYKFIETGNYEEGILHEGSNINGFFRDGDDVRSRIMVFERQ